MWSRQSFYVILVWSIKVLVIWAYDATSTNDLLAYYHYFISCCHINYITDYVAVVECFGLQCGIFLTLERLDAIFYKKLARYRKQYAARCRNQNMQLIVSS